MDLILWRHAEAHDALPFDNDMARTLTPKGQRQADRMAVWINQHLPEDATIWASPAERTQQTAQALGRKFKTSPEIAPGGSVAQLLSLARWPQEKGCVLLVGHQPTLGQAIAQLLEMDAAQCAVKKGALWWLRSRERTGHRQTVLLTVQSPELL